MKKTKVKRKMTGKDFVSVFFLALFLLGAIALFTSNDGRGSSRDPSHGELVITEVTDPPITEEPTDYEDPYRYDNNVSIWELF